MDVNAIANGKKMCSLLLRSTLAMQGKKTCENTAQEQAKPKQAKPTAGQAGPRRACKPAAGRRRPSRSPTAMQGKHSRADPAGRPNRHKAGGKAGTTRPTATA